MDAFRELGTCRPQGMGLGRIPWTAIHEYAVAEGVVDRSRFHTLIRRLDDELLTAYAERVDARRGSEKKPAKAAKS